MLLQLYLPNQEGNDSLNSLNESIKSYYMNKDNCQSPLQDLDEYILDLELAFHCLVNIQHEDERLSSIWSRHENNSEEFNKEFNSLIELINIRGLDLSQLEIILPHAYPSNIINEELGEEPIMDIPSTEVDWKVKIAAQSANIISVASLIATAGCAGATMNEAYKQSAKQIGKEIIKASGKSVAEQALIEAGKQELNALGISSAGKIILQQVTKDSAKKYLIGAGASSSVFVASSYAQGTLSTRTNPLHRYGNRPNPRS